MRIADAMKALYGSTLQRHQALAAEAGAPELVRVTHGAPHDAAVYGTAARRVPKSGDGVRFVKLHGLEARVCGPSSFGRRTHAAVVDASCCGWYARVEIA